MIKFTNNNIYKSLHIYVYNILYIIKQVNIVIIISYYIIIVENVYLPDSLMNKIF